MLSAFSPPPGIFWYCIAGKHFKSVIVFLSCLFAVLSFSQPRFLSGNKENADPAAKCTVVGPGDVQIREAAVVIRFREDLNPNEILANQPSI
jgi:hypothetical protein